MTLEDRALSPSPPLTTCLALGPPLLRPRPQTEHRRWQLTARRTAVSPEFLSLLQHPCFTPLGPSACFTPLGPSAEVANGVSPLVAWACEPDAGLFREICLKSTSASPSLLRRRRGVGYPFFAWLRRAGSEAQGVKLRNSSSWLQLCKSSILFCLPAPPFKSKNRAPEP